jgi:protein-disulfide isomerase
MSRKSKRNAVTPATAATGSASAAQSAPPTRRRGLFIAAIVGLLIAFVLATLFYKSQHAQSPNPGAVQNSAALASAQSPSAGDPQAKVHLVEFLDPACGTCAAFFPHVKALMAHPDRIRLSLRHVPFHRGSDLVVRILEASREQGKYMATLEGLYAAQNRWVIQHVVQADAVWQVVGGLGLDVDKLRRDMDSPAIARRMAQDMADAQSLGVSKTPEFFVNGRPLPRFGLDELKTLVDEEVRSAYR